eukprot:TRINITY_DN15815_c0_g1_i3.p1 TRINITY_DN15815_c0_g1~~TRINITY_DN15815_c0_g1_i3.p1  ORF type:complete len:432 (-),score=125.54 TRINITY_DN15815_c0_g1_i3:129-1424(-)
MSLRDVLFGLCCTVGRAKARARAQQTQHPIVQAWFKELRFTEDGAEVVDATAGAAIPGSVSAEVRANMTVAACKVVIEDLLGIPADEQRLLRSAAEFDDVERRGLLDRLATPGAITQMELDEEIQLFTQITHVWVLRSARLHQTFCKWSSFRFRSSHEDSARFHEAAEADDIPALVKLISSEGPVDEMLEPKHPWAAEPKSIGVLAAAYFVIAAAADRSIASSVPAEPDADCDAARLRRVAHEAGVLPPLLRLVESDQEDRVQVGVLALRFLLAEPGGRPTARAAYKAGIMPRLVDMLSCPLRAQAAAAASTLRNMFVTSEDCREHFVQLGGLERLVKQLDFDLASSEVNGNFGTIHLESLEAVLNLQDLVEDEKGHVFESYARLAVRSGAIEKLQRLTQTRDSDLEASSSELLEVLESFRGEPPVQAGGG